MIPPVSPTPSNVDQLAAQIERLGPWFQNLNLAGVPTAPDHFLGDYPGGKWRRFADALPQDLRGWSVLDIGCNAGFYCFELKRRGADRVLGIDSDPRYLDQARFAAQVQGLPVEFRQMSVFDLERLGERFRLVLMLGVLYHLRYPLLALDLVRRHVVEDLFLFQSMQRGADEIEPLAGDYDFSETRIFNRRGFPRLHFIEHRYASDPTNWWIPNRACTEALLRSSGFSIVARPTRDVYLCRCAPIGADIPRLHIVEEAES
jgi:tRNA (mo5U34)-methyltransferase